MKKIVYWSPIVSKIATHNAVINSALSLKKYSKNYDVSVINTIGEFDTLKNNESKVNLINFFKIKKKYEGSGFWKTRISLIRIFLNNFFKLKNFLKDSKPDYIIIHLLTSLPLILLVLFDFKTKFILRISGLPKMNLFRYILWKISLKKIYYVICPTNRTKETLTKMDFLDKEKIITIYDPVIKVKEQNKLKALKVDLKDYFISVGRLTKQKNFLFLIKTFKKLYDEKLVNEKLIIIGEGELKSDIEKFIKTNKLSDKIILLGYKENVFKYLSNSKAFILSSLWEDPGFVLVEAAFSKTILISSDCLNGPLEFLENKKNGFLFKSNSEKALMDSIINFKNSDKEIIKVKKVNALKSVKKFTFFRHFKELDKLLSS